MQKTDGKAARPYKGRSLIDFPQKYVVVDIETTGMSPGYCEICNSVFLRLQEDICAGGSSLEEFKGMFNR